MIKVYPNKLVDSEPEVYELDSDVTLLEFFRARGLPENADLGSLPMTVWNSEGRQILPFQWPVIVIGPTDCVDIYREPKGTDPFSITFALIFGAKAILSALMPKIPGIPNSSSGSGAALEEASAKGNRVKVNDPIPECAGFNRRYPDYAVPPRRYFTSPRAQWIEMALCVGVGQFYCDPSTIKIGETPLLSFGTDAQFAIYQPGADMSGDSSHLFWYSSPEVGQGSTGAAGLEMTVTTPLTLAATASVFGFNSTTVSIPVGAGSFPADWTPGLIVNIGDPYAYSIADGTGTGGRDVITGGNTANLGFVAGDLIQIQGDNAGLYTVFSTSGGLQLNYAGGAPASGLAVGTVTMSIGFQGLQYRILSYGAQALIVQRLKPDGSTDTGWPGWVSNSTNAGAVQLDNSNLAGGYRGPFKACPAGELATAIEWDVFFPSGLVYLDSKGNYRPLTSSHSIEYRDANGGGGWVVAEYQVTNNVLDALGYTYRINLPYPMVPEVRMKKNIINGVVGNSFVDKIMWYGLRALIPASSPSSYADVTMLTVKVRGADRVASATESLVNMEITRILPTLNGSGAWGPPVPTRQISAWIAYIAKSVGYTDADLNLSELQRLENIWSARGDFYDKIVADSDTVKGRMIEALQAGFSDLTIDRGVITPVRDDARGAVPNHIYDPMNMTAPLQRDAVYPTIDDFDGVDVEYLDRISWAKETVQCRLPGDLGERVDKITVDGVIDRDRAWRIGMRQRTAQVYRNKTYTFATELDALNSSYGDYTALGDAVIGYGQSAFMTSFVASGDGRYFVGTSETFDWSAGGTFKMSMRRKDGTIAGPYNVTRISDKVVSVMKTDFDSDPRTFTPDLSGVQEPPFLRFGPSASWMYPALIMEVSPSGTKGCKVTAVNYDERVYAYDNAIADN